VGETPLVSWTKNMKYDFYDTFDVVTVCIQEAGREQQRNVTPK